MSDKGVKIGLKNDVFDVYKIAWYKPRKKCCFRKNNINIKTFFRLLLSQLFCA